MKARRRPLPPPDVARRAECLRVRAAEWRVLGFPCVAFGVPWFFCELSRWVPVTSVPLCAFGAAALFQAWLNERRAAEALR